MHSHLHRDQTEIVEQNLNFLPKSSRTNVMPNAKKWNRLILEDSLRILQSRFPLLGKLQFVWKLAAKTALQNLWEETEN
jgi:hypothetical protein